ncbi:WLM-domain-containing protein [Dothidotthia symphoricarpi CBS 119687]|uniref:WLM-domain-containing protein n=1 Tax=Dothidotthia symphoricarpi CBS 119687 TaxID=1392245 RepID=A0A6A6AD50_9PLEO|nr:WLM-domain-containing protein [Dothidotthia symphoricarpi CBS 119687]KAF2129749.1 WLM-domain-containing protein [Dothidotthia symphoricarpi CBS 119687]
MPLGFERLNERSQRPNALINFIRTLPGPSSSTAEQILNRVAAVCYPFMKANTILVQALEEFPYNNEFVGRNFNAGEVIQLVLRDRNGRWLPQRMVEMVMVHELAHCKQMNHSKAFWKVRDAYAVDLRALWARGYTGEGLWGRGRDLDTGALQLSEGDVADVPEHLCGGTYGRRAKKRRRGGKEKEILSYAERKQRRILKKFGVGGQALGADDDTKIKLEGGVPKKAKPRVAGSARGRDLRAAAALARFDTVKKEEVVVKKEETSSDSETEDEFEDADSAHAAVDVDGKRMIDDKGRALVKICEDEDDGDGDAQRELAELQGFGSRRQPPGQALVNNTTKSAKPVPLGKSKTTKAQQAVSKSSRCSTRIKPTTCNICSLENELGSLTCAACSNVLDAQLVPDHWRCKNLSCAGSQYVNAGDAGRCGMCGGMRTAS